MYFNGRFVRNLALFATTQGADKHVLFTKCGKTEQELAAESCRVTPEGYNAFLKAAIAATGDELFGLHAGEHMNLQAAGLILQIAQSSQTVKQALEYCCEFANLGCNALPLALEEVEACYKLSISPDPLWTKQAPVAALQTLYGYMAFTLREFQCLTDSSFYPQEIWFRAAPPKKEGEIQRVLACPLHFEKGENALLFDKSLLSKPIVTSDYALLNVLVTHAEKKLKELAVNNNFYEIVKRCIIQMGNPEFPTISGIARHLNMSVRTFQRRLKAEGYSYKQVVDELRKEFAISYLHQPELSVSEIAYLLSYSDASTFIRSFRRWTGKTPVGFRKQLFTL
ncbi:MAG: AraC family transcriptional regulator [Bacteroidota bacterium]